MQRNNLPLLDTITDYTRCSTTVASNRRNARRLNTDFLRFLFSNFRYSLTALSHGFASFPHGTCTLSVSHQYLALDGIYHPLRAAIPNNSTRQPTLTLTDVREFHPLCCPIPEDLVCKLASRLTCHNSSQATIRILGLWGFTRRY